MTPTSPKSSDRLNATIAISFALALGIKAPANAGTWKWTVTPYVWATDVGIDVSVKDRQVIDETIPVRDLLEDMDTIAQVRVEAQRGAHGVMLDLFDVTLTSEATGAPLPNGAGSADVTADVGMTILDVAGVFEPRGDGRGFALLYGARVLDQRADIDASFDLGMPAPVDRHYEPGDTLVDALVGARYTWQLPHHWGLRVQADASTGSTDLTWSATPTVSYSFGKNDRFAVTAGYRYMSVDFASKDAVDAEMTLSGFLAGFSIGF